MTIDILEKASTRLNENGFGTSIKEDSLYLDIDGVELELSEREVTFQAELYDQENE